LQQGLPLTIDGLRGAVLQMIAHGFVVVGLFFISDIFRRYETRTIAEMVRTQSPRFADVLTFSISFSCSSYYFQLCWRVYGLIQPRKLMYGLPFRRNDYHLGAYYMLKMYQQVMLEKRIQKTFGQPLKKVLLWL
jgi:NADH-quinone oxidoreductase subunit M